MSNYIRLLVFTVLLTLSPITKADWYQRTDAIMGTRIFVELWSDDADQAHQLIQQVMDEMHRVDKLMSPYIETAQLAIVNRDAATRPVAITPELFNLIVTANHYSDLSGGAFDITYASLGHEFDYRKHIHPDAEQIKEALPLINYKAVKLDPAKHTIFFPHKGMQIDLGGIAKGYAVDKCIAILQKAGIKHAIVTAGGDSRLLGDHRGRPWMMGIKNPRGDSSVVSIPLENVAISTSGDYERYFIENGVRYDHIIDPKKGKSPTEVVSATIIADNATETDALSTTIFILGVKKGLELANSLTGVSAILIDHTGKIFYSNDLAPPDPKGS